MRSVRMHGNAAVTIEEVPAPEPGPGEVVVETAVSVLCGSEMPAYRGDGLPEGNTGHEAAGTIVKTGDGVALQPGQRVGVSAISGCGECGFCQKGQYTWCPERAFYGAMHAEQFLIAANACHPLPDDVSWEAGVLVTGDALGVPYHTSAKLRDKGVETVAILGVGPIGLGNVIMNSYLGRRVIAVDLSEARLSYAEAFGAQHTVNAEETEDVVAAIRGLTAGRGPDVCIEAAGEPETAKQCFAAVKTGGIVAFNGEQGPVELSPTMDFNQRDIWAVGNWYYHFSEFPAMLELYRSGLPIERLITHRYPFARADEAYRAMAARLTGKVVLEYG